MIVNWNSHDDLRDCLQSLRRNQACKLEVIVVDNASVDESVTMVRDEFSEVTLLAQTENLGFAEGCNRGIAVSHGDWIAMLNNDAVADERWAQALLEVLSGAAERLGMLQSLMLYRDRPNTVNSTGIELAFSGGGRDRNEGQTYQASPGPLEEIFCPTAGAAVYRRALLQQVQLPQGYFDRSHFMYYEDMDLGWRARLAGWSAQYVPQAIVYHRWHGSTKKKSHAWLITLANTNRIRTLLKNASWSFIVATLPRTFKELAELIWFGRFSALIRLARAIRESLGARRLVSAMARVSRREVERAWRAAPR